MAMIGVVLGGFGCATPGPNHVYILNPDQPDTIGNHTGTGIETSDVPSHLDSEDVLLGLAYDSYTDHLFLRLAPGNEFRVVDRPDRSIKREFAAPDIPTNGGGDLAIRSRDRHLFLSHPTQPALIEIILYEKFIRTIPLDDDSDAREFYAQLRASRDIGVFDEKGQLARTIEIPDLEIPAHFDVGPAPSCVFSKLWPTTLDPLSQSKVRLVRRSLAVPAVASCEGWDEAVNSQSQFETPKSENAPHR